MIYALLCDADGVPEYCYGAAGICYLLPSSSICSMAENVYVGSDAIDMC